MFLYLKSLHIIFVVSWFAALFYLPRLFIYQVEAMDKDEPDRSILSTQLKLMAKRLWYIIGWPAGIITLIFGGSLLWYYVPNVPAWLIWKVLFVLGLYGYHLFLHRIFKDLQADIVKYSSMQLRFINEIATILLFAIVFLVVLKDMLNTVYAVLGLLGLIIALTVAIKKYQQSRKRKK